MTKDEALQMALYALESFDKTEFRHGMLWQVPVIKAIRTALAQPEPEPVAYRCPDWTGHFEYTYWEPEERPSRSDGTPAGEPLYTAPPKKEWVSLTDEEKNEMTWGKTVYEILDLAETKLKEKNCG